MAYTLIKPGKYTAKVIDWGVNDKARVFITFAFTEDGKERTTTYRGGIDGKGLKYTLDALTTCGFNDTDLVKLAQGKAGGSLEFGREVQIVIEHRPSKDGSKTFDNVKFVNAIGGSKFQALMDQTAAQAVLGSEDIRAQIMAVRAEKGLPEPTVKMATVTAGDKYAWEE